MRARALLLVIAFAAPVGGIACNALIGTADYFYQDGGAGATSPTGAGVDGSSGSPTHIGSDGAVIMGDDDDDDSANDGGALVGVGIDGGPVTCDAPCTPTTVATFPDTTVNDLVANATQVYIAHGGGVSVVNAADGSDRTLLVDFGSTATVASIALVDTTLYAAVNVTGTTDAGNNGFLYSFSAVQPIDAGAATLLYSQPSPINGVSHYSGNKSVVSFVDANGGYTVTTPTTANKTNIIGGSEHVLDVPGVGAALITFAASATKVFEVYPSGSQTYDATGGLMALGAGYLFFGSAGGVSQLSYDTAIKATPISLMVTALSGLAADAHNLYYADTGGNGEPGVLYGCGARSCASSTVLATGLSSPTLVDAHNTAALFFVTQSGNAASVNRLVKPAAL